MEVKIFLVSRDVSYNAEAIYSDGNVTVKKGPKFVNHLPIM